MSVREAFIRSIGIAGFAVVVAGLCECEIDTPLGRGPVPALSGLGG
jgi:hypothetical protein